MVPELPELPELCADVAVRRGEKKPVSYSSTHLVFFEPTVVVTSSDPTVVVTLVACSAPQRYPVRCQDRDYWCPDKDNEQTAILKDRVNAAVAWKTRKW